MKDFIKTATKLYVAVNEKGEVINSNDFKNLGPAFALTDTKVVMDKNGEVVENYALHIDENFCKQGSFSILGCTKTSAAMIAKIYCEKHHISPVKGSWLYRNNDENVYQVVDADDVEYHFHIARAWFDYDGSLRDYYGAYISINNKGKFSFIEITNLNDL